MGIEKQKNKSRIRWKEQCLIIVSFSGNWHFLFSTLKAQNADDFFRVLRLIDSKNTTTHNLNKQRKNSHMQLK